MELDKNCIVAKGINGQPSIFRCVKCNEVSRGWYAKQNDNESMVLYCPLCNQILGDTKTEEKEV